MSPSAVPNAARQGRQNVTATAVTEPRARCSPRPAPSVGKAPKSRSNLGVIGRFTVAIATVKSDLVDKVSLISGHTWAEDNWPVYVPRMCWYVMTLQVSMRAGESQESLLRRFQRMVQTSGVLREAKAHRYFISKRDAARIKAKNSARKRRRQGN